MTIWQTLGNWWMGDEPLPEPPWPPRVEPPGDGWMEWCHYLNMHSANWLPHDSPYEHEWVSIWRQEWEQPSVVTPHELPKWLNVSGLYWKPAP